MWKKYLPLGIVITLIVVGGAVWFVVRTQQTPVSQSSSESSEQSFPASPTQPQAAPAEPGGGGGVPPVPPVPVVAEQEVSTTLTVDEKENIQEQVNPSAQPIPVPVPPTPAPALAAQHQVQFDGAAFSPKMLTVRKGDSVVFVNNGKNPMWVASAMHPTHRVYPTTGGCLGSTFDACRGYDNGSSWSFTFDEVGSWGYHDHLNPGAFGKIVVEN